MVAHNPAAAYVGGSELKLRLDQGEDHSVRSYQLEGIRQDQSQGNKGNVDHAEIDRFRNIRLAEKSRVELFPYDHARIAPDFPGQLPMANIDRVNLSRAFLEQTIGEPSSRSADIQRRNPVRRNRKMPERPLEFQSTAAHISRASVHRERCVRLDFGGSLIDHRVPDPYLSGHDR